MREHTAKALTLLPLTPLAKLNSKAAGKGAGSWGLLCLSGHSQKGEDRENQEKEILLAYGIGK